MKKIFILSSIIALSLIACDKVDNAYPPDTYTGGLDPDLYPGNITDYVTPVFTTNTNTDRNVLIEDFTGHTCVYCPYAADEAHSLEVANPGRVYTSTIHSGPDNHAFQIPELPNLPYDFRNDVSTEIGFYFGSIPGNDFSANPAGNVSRYVGTGTSISSLKDEWGGKVNDLISTNDLKVNIQSVVNYFDQTKGAFIHVEVEKLESISNELRLVVAFYEDSMVQPQKYPSLTDMDYVHRDLLKFHVNGNMNGQKVDDESLDVNGNHYFEYSVKLPTEIAADNAHLLIYVFDKETEEIYQVIKKKFI